jgi:hypothetical protein
MMGTRTTTRLAAVAAALTATLLTPAAGLADTIPISPFEVEVISVPAGLAGATCLPVTGPTSCSINNGSVGSGCSEIEIENPNIALPPTLGEGFDTTPCQALISAYLTVTGCTVTGSGSLWFQEDSPVGGAAGGTFPFQVRGTLSNAVMYGVSSPGPSANDAVEGTLVLGACGGTSISTATYTAHTVFVGLPPPLGG